MTYSQFHQKLTHKCYQTILIYFIMVSIKYKAQKNMHTDSSNLKLPGKKHTKKLVHRIIQYCTHILILVNVYFLVGSIYSGTFLLRPPQIHQNEISTGERVGGDLDRESKMLMPCSSKKGEEILIGNVFMGRFYCTTLTHSKQTQHPSLEE